jgi:hypothetical protein
MTDLEGLIQRLNDAGVEVIWCMDLPAPGLWLSEYLLLVLAVSHSSEASVRACRQVLRQTVGISAA